MAFRVLEPGDPQLDSSTALGDAVAHVQHVPPSDDPAMERDRAAMLALAAQHADALDRSCPPGHFTGSALVVGADGEHVLVLHHRKLQRWLQPGGHADGDGNLAAVAWREATEETGIEGLRVVVPGVDLDVHVVAPPGEREHRHHDVRFVVLAPAGAAALGNHESTALRWVRVDELAALGADPGLLRLAHTGLVVARQLLGAD